jgi:hypothetical protein
VDFRIAKLRVPSVHEFNAVVYDSSAVITAFESWNAWEASLRIKYSPTIASKSIGSLLPHKVS